MKAKRGAVGTAAREGKREFARESARQGRGAGVRKRHGKRVGQRAGIGKGHQVVGVAKAVGVQSNEGPAAVDGAPDVAGASSRRPGVQC
jgi:hypothetical protein